MKTFVFKNTNGSDYTFEDFGSLMDTFMGFTPNFLWNHHLPLPNSPAMKTELQKIQKRDYKNSEATEHVEQNYSPLRRLLQKLRGQ